jgi:cytochrome c-type biogenesis protein CcmE
MSLLPKSRKARRRLAAVGIAAPILIAAAVLAFFALGNSVSFFYSPSQAKAASVPAGRTIELGGLVAAGSLRKTADGGIVFVVADHRDQDPVAYKGELPDLFREGQGVVAIGAFDQAGVFVATQILAKHDEKYMPPQLAAALRKQGEWRGDGATPSYGPRSGQ